MEETYDLYTYLPEMREAMDKWEAFVGSLTAAPLRKRLNAALPECALCHWRYGAPVLTSTRR